MKKSVSVIIPFFMGVNWLEEAIESVLLQTYSAHEIIVVNDGSPEDVSGVLDKYGDKIRYVTQVNRGPASARNLGICLSTGDYVAFLDSDDLWLPTKLQKQVDIMRKSGALWSHTAYETFHECNQVKQHLRTIPVGEYDGMIYPRILMSNRLATPCIMIDGDFIRRSADLRFEDGMRYGQDQALWVRISRRHPVVAVDEVLTRVRMRGTNASLRTRVQIAARSDIWHLINVDPGGFGVTELPTPTKLAFHLSDVGIKCLGFVERFTRNERILECASKVLYLTPWILFKLDYARGSARRSSASLPVTR